MLHVHHWPNSIYLWCTNDRHIGHIMSINYYYYLQPKLYDVHNGNNINDRHRRRRSSMSTHVHRLPTWIHVPVLVNGHTTSTVHRILINFLYGNLMWCGHVRMLLPSACLCTENKSPFQYTYVVTRIFFIHQNQSTSQYLCLRFVVVNAHQYKICVAVAWWWRHERKTNIVFMCGTIENSESK